MGTILFYNMQLIQSNPLKSKNQALLGGLVFLLIYWWIGFDGITFSDDVYYLMAGKRFWEGTMEFNSYHFSTRWGAYIPSGLVGFLVGFDPHLISLISWISYAASLGLLIKLLPSQTNPWILVLWSCTQVYFLHFLTKVYPDSQLVFWTVLVPFAATFRKEKPFWAALGVVSGLFFGFLTKETMVFLAPFPLLLACFDLGKKDFNPTFYLTLAGIGILFGCVYLGYFWWKFGNPFYRFESIQDGHYISEFTYADKSAWVMFKRLTIFPIVTFIQRAYWPWIVLALPALAGLKANLARGHLEVALALICLIVCFWMMSTNLRFYNPLYLNPRHLIPLVPLLSFLVALGWEKWQNHPKLKKSILSLLLFGVAVSLNESDLKMALFYALFALVLWPNIPPLRSTLLLSGLLLIPALYSIRYQQTLKDYPNLLETLQQLPSESPTEEIVLTNNFIHFSREILLPEDPITQARLVQIEKLDSLKTLGPKQVRVIVYDYYRHAYPKEKMDVDALEKWLESEYQLIDRSEKGPIEVRTFVKK